MIALLLLGACIPTSIWEGRCTALGGRVGGDGDCVALPGDTADDWDGTVPDRVEITDVAAVFFTEEAFPGDLEGLGFGNTAHQVGDYLCQREADAWTGTRNGGGVDQNCNDFTSSSSSNNGVYGRPSDELEWTQSAYGDCDERRGLYCFSDL